MSLPSPLLEISFESFLSQQQHSKIYLDSAIIYLSHGRCDFSTLALIGPDSVEVSYNYSCQDSVLLHYIQTNEIPFFIESIVPNPSRYELKVVAKQFLEGAIAYQMIDVLGRTVLQGDNVQEKPLQVGLIPSGIYNLMLSQAGFSQSKKIVVEH